MNLTWHIVAKDIRRMAGPVAVWVAFIVVTTMGFIFWPMPRESSFAGAVNFYGVAWRWMSDVAVYKGLVTGMQLCIGGILAAYFAQLDLLVDTTAFWQTRPVSDRRLFSAKIIGAGILFILAPTIAMIAVWLIERMSAWEVIRAMSEFALWQLLPLVLGLALGALTANLGAFLFAAIAYVTTFVAGEMASRTEIQHLAVGFVLLSGPVAMMLLQFLGRKRGLGWYAFAATILLAIVGLLHPPPELALVWNQARDGSRVPGPTIPEEAQIPIAIGPITANGNRDVVRFNLGASASEDLVPAVVRAEFRTLRDDGLVASDWFPGPKWGDEAALRVVAGVSRNPNGSWSLENWSPPARLLGADPKIASAKVRVAWMRPMVEWTIPLHTGASGRAGSDHGRIVRIQEDGESCQILLRELDPRLASSSGINVADRNSDTACIDCFVVRNGRNGFVTVAERTEIDAKSMNCMRVTVRGLKFPAPVLPDAFVTWCEGATLTKVRFERVREFERHVELRNVEIRRSSVEVSP